MFQCEQELEKACIDYLNGFDHVLAFKFPRGQKSATRRNTVRHSGQGVADIICNYSYRYINWVIYLECKSPKGSIRESQRKFRDAIRELAGFYFVIRSLDDCKLAIETVKAEADKQIDIAAIPF